MSAIEWGAALALGFMGSTHCVAMCGPIATVLCNGKSSRAVSKDAPEKDAVRPVRHLPILSSEQPLGLGGAAATHAGRISTYAVLGALAGGVGAGLRSMVALSAVQLGARIGAALLLVCAGLYVSGLFARFARIEAAVAPVFRRLAASLARPGATGMLGRYLRGAGWGLVPCGLVMGALGLAILSGKVATGAGLLVVFGLGTLPALLAVHLFATAFQRAMRGVWWKRAAGLMIVTSGVAQMAFAAEEIGSFGKADAQRACCAHHGTH